MEVKNGSEAGPKSCRIANMEWEEGTNGCMFVKGAMSRTVAQWTWNGWSKIRDLSTDLGRKDS